jgi:hypothetical protein
MVSIERRVVVSGGGLRPGQAWVPDVVPVGVGEFCTEFVELNGSRQKLCAAFFACKEHDTCLAAFSILRNARNAAVDELLVAHVNKDVEAADEKPFTELPSTFKRVNFDPNLFPRILKVGVEPCGENSITVMSMLFDLNALKNPSIELSEVNLRYVIDLIRKVVQGTDDIVHTATPKRQRVRRSITGTKLVESNFQRGTLVSKYRDCDGRIKRVTTRPESLNIESVVKVEVQWHLDQIKQLHHIESEDGHWEYANDLPTGALVDAAGEDPAEDLEPATDEHAASEH